MSKGVWRARWILRVSAHNCSRLSKLRANKMTPPTNGCRRRRFSSLVRVAPAISTMTGPGGSGALRFFAILACPWVMRVSRTASGLALDHHVGGGEVGFIGDGHVGGAKTRFVPFGQAGREHQHRPSARRVERLHAGPGHGHAHAQADSFGESFFGGKAR